MGAVRGVPQPFPYQGSKRQLAKQIVACIPAETKRLLEPFAGSAAVALATAHLRRARYFYLNDAHEPLVKLWKQIVNEPEKLAHEYESLWLAQSGRERMYYDWVRSRFNESNEPHYVPLSPGKVRESGCSLQRERKVQQQSRQSKARRCAETMGQNIRNASALFAAESA